MSSRVGGEKNRTSTLRSTPERMESWLATGVGQRRERAASRPSLLIVEDEADFQEVLLEAFHREYDVILARSAAAAHTALASHTPVAMILDHRLPDCTGLDFLREIRARQPVLPVIMITGYGSEFVCLMAFKLGVADYFIKPMNIFDVVAAVRKAVGHSAERSQTVAPPSLLGKPELSEDIGVQRAILLIFRAYWHRLSLEQVARRIDTSKYALSRRFSRIMGISFRQYLLETRLERAKQLLLDSSVTITDIAQIIGFNDLPHFDKAFRRHEGVSPSQYRAGRLVDWHADESNGEQPRTRRVLGERWRLLRRIGSRRRVNPGGGSSSAVFSARTGRADENDWQKTTDPWCPACASERIVREALEHVSDFAPRQALHRCLDCQAQFVLLRLNVR